MLDSIYNNSVKSDWFLIVVAFSDSPFRDDINQAILQLKEDRRVQELKEKWWITKNTDDITGEMVNCTKKTESSLDTPELDIDHVSGAFMVLIMGFGLSILIGILDFLWNVRKVSILQKVNSKMTRSMNWFHNKRFWTYASERASKWTNKQTQLISLIATCVFDLDHTIRSISKWIVVCMQGLDYPKTCLGITRIGIVIIRQFILEALQIKLHMLITNCQLEMIQFTWIKDI